MKNLPPGESLRDCHHTGWPGAAGLQPGSAGVVERLDGSSADYLCIGGAYLQSRGQHQPVALQHQLSGLRIFIHYSGSESNDLSDFGIQPDRLGLAQISLVHPIVLISAPISSVSSSPG